MSQLLQTRSGVEMRPRVNTGGKGGLCVPGFQEDLMSSKDFRSRRCEADNGGSAFSVLLKARERRERAACKKSMLSTKHPKCKVLEHSQLPMLLSMKASSGLINNPIG